MHIGEQGRAVPHLDVHVDVTAGAVLRVAQVAIIATRSLRTVELALTRLGARDSNHGDLSNHGDVWPSLLGWRGFVGEFSPADNIDVGFTRT